MKPTNLLITAFLLTTLNAGLVFSQKVDVTPVAISPFSKGDFYMNMSNDLSFSWMKLKTGDVDEGHQNGFGLHYEGTYFLMDNFGLGIGISSDKIGRAHV